MKTRRLFTQILAIALCLAMLCPMAALAEDVKTASGSDSYAVIDPAALQKLVEEYAAAKGYNKNNISVGYCYLDTGDTWYYNGDNWGFGAGVYYVPMMMLISEWESSGRMTRDSKVGNYTIGDAERLVLSESNWNAKNQVLPAIGTEREMREKIRTYSPLPEDYYDASYLQYGYMSAHFLTDVLKTLYNENERFPNIIDCMKERGKGQFFAGAMGGAYSVAQQFGSLEEGGGTVYNNCIGIIYTPHPFALTVMTKNLGARDEIMWDLSVKFKDYTLTLDGAYDKWSANAPATPSTPATPATPVTPDAPDAAGTPTITIPEPATPDTQEPDANTEGQPAEAPVIQLPGLNLPGETEGTEEQPAEEGETAIIQTGEPETQGEGQEQTAAGQTPAKEQTPAKSADSHSSSRMIILLIGAALLVILFLFAIVHIIKRRKEADEDEYEDEEDEDEDEEDEEY